MELNTATVWAEETPGPARSRKLPGNHWLLAFATLGLLVAAGGSIWVYLSGLRTLRVLAAQIGDNSPAGSSAALSHLLAEAHDWGLQIAVAAVAGGLVLFLVVVLGGSFQRRRWLQRHAKLY